MVYEAASGGSDIDRKRIEIKLQGIDEKMLARKHQWDNALSWLVNAEDEHSRQHFHAILSQDNPKAHDWVLAYETLDETTPLWAIKREIVVSRDASQLAQAIAPLVRVAKSVIFIDPHFDPYKAKLRNTIKTFLEACLVGRDEIKLERVEFHTSFKPAINDFAGECLRQLPQRIPVGISLKVIRLRERAGGDGLHNRYILTERGGIRLAWGLDEGGPAETDDISLLDTNGYEARWAQYCGDQPAFDFHDELVIVGTRVLP